jgi:hypothetical protein
MKFQPQAMRLVLTGMAKNPQLPGGATKVLFRIEEGGVPHYDAQGRYLGTTQTPDVTRLPGYAGNATSDMVKGASRDYDYSFNKDDNQASAKDTDLTFDQNRGTISTPFYAKDYGGKVTVVAILLDANDHGLAYFPLTLPVDKDNDGIADKWEHAKAREYEAQYRVNIQQDWNLTDLQFINPSRDLEPFGPDSGKGRQPPGNPPDRVPSFFAPGDGLSAFYEYRGILVDGGGFSPDGKHGQPPGHMRLSPARHEVLIAVDKMRGAPTSQIPKPAVVQGWMETVTRAYSQRNYGLGTDAYYVLRNMEAPNTPFTKDYKTITDMQEDLRDYVLNTLQFKNPLNWGFRHLLIASKPGTLDAYTKGEISGYSSITTMPMDLRFGSIYFVDDAWDVYKKSLSKDLTAADNDPKVPRNEKVDIPKVDFDTFSAGVITHELAHQLDYRLGHNADADGDGRANQGSDFETVQFDYTQKPLPAGYYHQDYWGVTIKYGHGNKADDFFPATMYLPADGMLFD